MRIALSGLWPPGYSNDAQNGRFYTKDALSVCTNMGKHFVVCLVMRL